MRKKRANDLVEAFKKALAGMSKEDLEKYFPPDKKPKGWISIEDHLPMMYAMDIGKGYTVYKVKFADGREGETAVSDHNVWYYEAKNIGITHWYNP